MDSENVAQLRPAWQVQLDGSGAGLRYSAEATPIVQNGVMYVSTGANDVFALDGSTGARLWTYHANLPQDISAVCCGWANRGVALGGGKIFLGRLDGTLVALDQETGQARWSVEVGDWREGFTITGAPLYFKNMVIIGSSGGDIGIRGSITAYSAENGERLWRFWTVPAAGERGHSSWPDDNDSWMTGGGAVTNAPSLDPDLGLLYFGTGNPAPSNGHLRRGSNLYTSSIVALEALTGRYRWHFQVVHHDIWDYQCSSTPVLLDVEVEGRRRQALGAACKTGWLYVLDRATGEPLVPIQERRVPQNAYQRTAPTQPFPSGDAFVPQCADPEDVSEQDVNGEPLVVSCIFTPYDLDGFVSIKPSALGGANWPPVSFSPETKFAYICAVDRPTALRALPLPLEQGPNEFYTGVTGSLGRPEQIHGTFTAIDVRTNRIAWQHRWDEQMCYSGSLATAGGLVFTGRGDRGILAYDAMQGNPLWEFKTEAGANAPPIAYSIAGQQYIAIFAGGSIQGGRRTPHGDFVVAFALPR